MKQKVVKVVLGYYRGIPSALRELQRERRELRGEERSAAARLAEIADATETAERDRALVAGCLDGIAVQYKRVLQMRYGGGYSWGRISAEMGVPDSTVRHWHDRALQRMGEALEAEGRAEALVERAMKARL